MYLLRDENRAPNQRRYTGLRLRCPQKANASPDSWAVKVQSFVGNNKLISYFRCFVVFLIHCDEADRTSISGHYWWINVSTSTLVRTPRGYSPMSFCRRLRPETRIGNTVMVTGPVMFRQTPAEAAISYRPHHCCRPPPASCSSRLRFASGKPSPSATTCPCWLCRGIAPSSECALEGSKKKPRGWRGFKSTYPGGIYKKVHFRLI
jgi:hypothetical protein